MPLQMIDSHIHLYELEHLSSLSWMTPRNQLHGQHSVAEYISSKEATGSTKSPQADSRQLSGFIFVEVDRINTPSSKLEGWKDPLQEFSFVASISLGLIPKYAMHSSLVLGIIPWAPIPHGVKAMKEYEAELCALHSEPDKNGVKMPYKVKGFRYLLQSEPRGTMLSDDFIGSLRWMGERGYVFECTIDCNESKIWQLQEVIEMMQRVNRDVQKVEELVQVIISHLAKPDFASDPTTSTKSTRQYYDNFLSHIDAVSRFPNVAIKFSGAFSQLPTNLQRQPIYPADSKSTTEETEAWIASVVQRVSPWTNRIYKSFGGRRMIWGSDWPVCNMVGGKNAWTLWQTVSERLLSEAGISAEEKEAIWSENSKRLYKINVLGNQSSRI